MQNYHFAVVRCIQGINLELGLIIALGDSVLDAMRRATATLQDAPTSAPDLLIFSNDPHTPLDAICPMDLLLAPGIVVRVWPSETVDGEASCQFDVVATMRPEGDVVWRHVNQPTRYCQLGRDLSATTINATLCRSVSDLPNTYATSPVSVRVFHSALIYASPWRVSQ